MIKFPVAILEPRALCRVVKVGLLQRDSVPSLTEIFPKRTHEDLLNLANSWRKSGLGNLLEMTSDGEKEVVFSINNRAVAAAKLLERKSIRGCVRGVPRSDWISIAALVVSIFAFFKQGH